MNDADGVNNESITSTRPSAITTGSERELYFQRLWDNVADRPGEAHNHFKNTPINTFWFIALVSICYFVPFLHDFTINK